MTATTRARRRALGLALIVLASLVSASPTVSVAQTATRSASAGTTLHVALPEPVYQRFDPQASYTGSQWEVLRCCLNRTLLTYLGTPNAAGTVPVPDLATALPTVSADGLTWTFHLRPGIHYSPPLQDVQVTSYDIVRALLRAGSAQALPDGSGGVSGPGAGYLTLVQGFQAYRDGHAATISGVSAPDPLTLTVHESRPDRAIEHLFAQPFSAPIPPLPSDPNAPLGLATGHPFFSDYQAAPTEAGYGPFMVTTGPYMFLGTNTLDVHAPADQEAPAAGNAAGAWFDDPGTITLVRNPSWEAATDPNRPAYPDRIEISVLPQGDPYRALQAGTFDTVIGESPPPNVVQRYADSPTLRPRLRSTPGQAEFSLALNVAQPPFDDVAVRRAFAFALDRAALTSAWDLGSGGLSSHLVPDPMDASLLGAWDPFPTPKARGDPTAARAEMRRSRYAGSSGRCEGSVCHVDVVLQPRPGNTPAQAARAQRVVGAALAAIGVSVRFVHLKNDCAIGGPAHHVAICAPFGWIVDYPDPGNMFVPDLSSKLNTTDVRPTLLGASPHELASMGYATRHVPSIDADYERCGPEGGLDASMCWARLDQELVYELAAMVPVFASTEIRLAGPQVTALPLDQSCSEVALDKVQLNP